LIGIGNMNFNLMQSCACQFKQTYFYPRIPFLSMDNRGRGGWLSPRLFWSRDTVEKPKEKANFQKHLITVTAKAAHGET